ncbi:hypothetical protein HUW86_11740 (plasmid) [Fusobacterium sp. SB021]|uniref:hypothetical protein n=1 Tax=Fusobacterium sp. SB021 TaxID=2744227 RepID=UPI003CEAB7D4
MKSFFKYSLLIIVLLLTSCGRVTEQETRKALSEHLKTRYNEEFNIGLIGRRSDDRDTWYQAKIYPKKYEGTIREYDEYYHRNGTVDIKKGIFGESIDYVGDTYRIVLMNESANKFYLPKLKELFGENVLPVLDINIAELSIYPEFLTEMKERMKAGGHPQIKGGIYIFGRVESDKDREWYRKQIYEFVQFMKETGTFEYVSLWLVVADERVLSDEFVNNTEDKEKLLRLHNENEAKFRKQRAEIMKKYSKSYNETPIENIRERIGNILKSDLYDTSGNAIGLARMTYYNELLVTPLYSEKYIKSQSLEDNYRLKDYDKVEDIEFTEEFY